MRRVKRQSMPECHFCRIVSPLYFMISIKLMTDGIIRGSGAMAYFVAATVPDLILRIGFAHLLTPKFGSTGIWMAWPFGWFAATALTILFYRKVIEKCNYRTERIKVRK
ncbi:MAG: polysaccharide biosynthesis C-terminal domain-containing protein [Clostridium sp.]